MSKYPFYMQTEIADCGATCLKMVSEYYGRKISRHRLKDVCNTHRDGVSLLGLCRGAKAIGLNPTSVRIEFEELIRCQFTPFIVHVNGNHFIVVYEISQEKVRVADPGHGVIMLTRTEFLRRWSTASDDRNEGVVLFLETTPVFLSAKDELADVPESSFKGLYKYLRPYKGSIFRLIVSLLLGSMISLSLPFLTQSIVDIGINHDDLGFVKLILFGQLMFFAGKLAIEFLRSWILLHVGSRISISLISNFLAKLMQLPMSFFDTKNSGDLLQRIDDHSRIQEFLTSTTLSVLFSVFNIVIFGIVIALYNLTIFLLFVIGTLCYVAWAIVFLKKRRELDYKMFRAQSAEQGNIVEIIGTMRDIKLYNLEVQRKTAWEKVQARILKYRIKRLSLGQLQLGGASAVNEVRNILILFVCASEVIAGQISFGSMLAVQYILGQLNGPVNDLVNFINLYQDAKLSYERLDEINALKGENEGKEFVETIPPVGDILFEEVDFRYPGIDGANTLENISFKIPRGKTTAIVGESGSGKSTIVKLLLQFYEPTAGLIKMGDLNFNRLEHTQWRNRCGVVLQNSAIFSGTLSSNICLQNDGIDIERMINACKAACIFDFVNSLPLSFDSKVGPDGLNLSEGQKQRILLARVIYRDPEVVLLDEATNSLDSKNELRILQNLKEFFVNKTVLVIAHRLSTIRFADQIIVMSKGKIVEDGDHDSLLDRKGNYFELVKSQLEAV